MLYNYWDKLVNQTELKTCGGRVKEEGGSFKTNKPAELFWRVENIN